MKKTLIALLILVVGITIGYYLHPEPTMWDIFDDPRGCVIQWDDGEIQYKSRQISLGTLQLGESKIVELDWNMEVETIDIDVNITGASNADPDIEGRGTDHSWSRYPQ